jgi:hypothetical protein
MRRKTWIIAVAILVLAGALAGGLYWRWANSPRYALQQAALALQARDMNKFFIYVNLKEILNNFIEASSKDLESPEDQPGDEWTKFSKQLGRKFAHLFLPKLFEAFETQIRGVMERYLLHLNNSQIVGIAAAATVAQIDSQGDEAGVTLIDPKTKDPFRFHMRRQPNHGDWQIVSVNYDDLKRFSKREFHHKP